jgi:tetratricopeptide (TPR) repeat protein
MDSTSSAPPKTKCPLLVLFIIFMTTAAIVIVGDFASAQTRLSLSGRVTTNDGVVIPSGVTLLLETDEGTPVAQQSADASGQFSFQGLRVKNYRLTVTCKGFETYTKDVQMEFGANLSNVNVFLNPLNVRKVVKSAPLLSDESASKKSVKYFGKGERAFLKKKLGDAQKFFEAAVADSPCYARAWNELALVNVEQKNLKDAEVHFRKAMNCDGQFLDAYSGLAQLYKDEMKYSQAEAVLLLGIQRSPVTWQFYDRLGLLHYAMKEYKKSEADFLKVLAINSAAPPDVDAQLANAYLKEARYDKAYLQMMKYMREAPNGRFTPSIDRVVKVMKAHGLVSPKVIENELHSQKINH